MIQPVAEKSLLPQYLNRITRPRRFALRTPPVRRWFSQLALICLLSVLAFADRKALATETLPLSLEETIRRADLILLGTVSAKQSHWGDETKRWMLTDYTFAVEETLYASGSRKPVSNTVTLTYWGGTIADETQTISDLRLPQTGERLMVMLRPGWDRDVGFTPVVGFNEGLFGVTAVVPGGPTVVNGYAGEPLLVSPTGTVSRQRDVSGSTDKASPVELGAFKSWLKSSLPAIKSKPSEIKRPVPADDPRLLKPFAKTPLLGRRTQAASPVAAQIPLTGQAAASQPCVPLQPSQTPGGGETTTQLNNFNHKYLSNHQAHLPIVVNNFPPSFTDWVPEDQYQMSKWNYYASDVFRVYTTPTGTYAWPDGVFDLAGWPSSADLQRVYGSPWDANTIGVTFLRYDGGGWIIEADIALNPAFAFTLDDEWVYNGSYAQTFRQVLTHELGHMHGLEHQFNFLSEMNYMPAAFRAFCLPYMDDTAGIRAEYPGNAVSLTDLAVYLYYSSGYQSVSDASITYSVPVGGALGVNNYHVENVGITTIATPTLEWYLTAARNFSSAYYYLGSSTYPSLAPFTYFTPNSMQRYFTIPAGVPPGNYYLAAFIRNDSGTGQSSFPFDNNRAFSRFQVTVTGPPPPPNDQCYGAIPLSGGVPYAMNTSAATAVGDPTPTCGSGVTKGVWFSYTPGSDGNVVVSTCGSSFDTVLQVYSGSCGTLVPVVNGCDDDFGPSCPSLQASVQFTATAGNTYFMLVGGYGSGSGNLKIVVNPVVIIRPSTVGNQFQFSVSGTPGANCSIQMSSNLINWVPLGTYAIQSNGVVVVTDSRVLGGRYYRAVIP